MITEPYRRVAVVGGAGFIGSHLIAQLLTGEPSTESLVVYDNFSSGRAWHLEPFVDDRRLRVTEGDVHDLERLVAAFDGATTVVHLASNPDIARAVTEPTVDFDEGTELTNHVAEAARRAGVEQVLYASGSGVYGDIGEVEADEGRGGLEPVSTYGASKLAGEALLCSYAHMFGIRARAFRFGNVVGPRQTHGVGFDFVRKLLADPSRLAILGDGRQSKSYVHVDDVLSAVLLAGRSGDEPYRAFNVATGDYVTVTDIARIAIECLGLDPERVRLEYEGGDRGWKGDVPVVRLSTARIRGLGWTNRYSSAEAMRASIGSMLADAEAGRLW
jgi:UDP-glucose 4-epimerase